MRTYKKCINMIKRKIIRIFWNSIMSASKKNIDLPLEMDARRRLMDFSPKPTENQSGLVNRGGTFRKGYWFIIYNSSGV